MALFDMPLEKLKIYEGSSPCPDDFDNYWERGLKEMRETNSDVELIPNEFKVPFAECFDLYFTGVRNARIHAKYIRPKNAPQIHPAVIHFHGYGGHSGDWNDKLQYAAMGFSVAALDLRGQGGLSEDTGGVTGNTFRGHIIRGLDSGEDNLLFRHNFLDAAQLAGIVMEMPEVDKRRVAAVGGSQGGGLTIACAALEPRICKAAPMYPFLSDYKRVWDIDLAINAYQEIQNYFKLFDPRHEKETEFFSKLGYIDVQNLAKRIKAEVLMATGLMDQTCPPSTQFAAYNKINAPKDIVIYPDFGHEFLPGFLDMTYEFIAKLIE